MPNSKFEIKRHDSQSMGINSIGLDYCKVEDILHRIGPKLTTPHRHEYYEVIWFTECSGSHMVEFVNYELLPNMMFFFDKNQIHAFRTIDNIKGHMLRFDSSFLKRLQKKDATAIEYSLFRIHSSPIRYISDEAHSRFATLISLIQAESKNSGKRRHAEMLLSLLNAFLIEAERITPEDNTTFNSRQDHLESFYMFTSLLEENFNKHYNVAHYAKLLQLHPKALRTICQNVSGLSAKRIIQERICLEAKRYLHHTNLDVQEISFKLGFEDPAYFSRFFKNNTKQTPSIFRATKS